MNHGGDPEESRSSPSQRHLRGLVGPESPHSANDVTPEQRQHCVFAWRCCAQKEDCLAGVRHAEHDECDDFAVVVVDCIAEDEYRSDFFITMPK